MSLFFKIWTLGIESLNSRSSILEPWAPGVWSGKLEFQEFVLVNLKFGNLVRDAWTSEVRPGQLKLQEFDPGNVNFRTLILETWTSGIWSWKLKLHDFFLGNVIDRSLVWETWKARCLARESWTLWVWSGKLELREFGLGCLNFRSIYYGTWISKIRSWKMTRWEFHTEAFEIFKTNSWVTRRELGERQKISAHSSDIYFAQRYDWYFGGNNTHLYQDVN